MRASFYYSLLIFLVVVTGSCKKDHYKSLSGQNTLTGYVFLRDTINFSSVTPLAGQKLYLNTAGDTASYIYETRSDSAGLYSIPSLQSDEDYILFTRHINNEVEYKGAVRFRGGTQENVIRLDLEVYASQFNGISLLFTDATTGILPNLPFRVYASRLAAMYDSTAFASINASSDRFGQYSRYNLAAVKYYVVSSKSIGPDSYSVFDSVIVPSAGIARATIKLH